MERAQESGGSWSSTWYQGPYYGVLAALRLLCAARPGSPAVAAAADFLRRTQLPGGGWGIEGTPDALSTGLALLALATAPNPSSDEGDRERAAAGRDFLGAAHRPDDGWAGCPFIQMAVGARIRRAGADCPLQQPDNHHRVCPEGGAGVG